MAVLVNKSEEMERLAKDSKELSRVPMYVKKSIEDITKHKTNIRIITEFCKGCELCTNYCPEKILQLSTDFNSKSYHYPFVIKEMNEKCTQCRMCERICPEMAIFLKDDNNNSGKLTKV